MEKFNHALIVIDPTQEGENMDILRFVAYYEEPTPKDFENLKNQLLTNHEFGLTDIAERLEIISAPDFLVERMYEELTKNQPEQ